jgi:hypothetical protein
MSKKLNYINNEEFFVAMQERIALVKDCESKGIPKPRISE